MIRGLWENLKNGANGVADPQWFTILDGYLQTKTGAGFGDAFVEFATWNLFTGKHADPTRGYKAGAGYPELQMTDATAPYYEKDVRAYYASSQYYRLAPGQRSTMTAALAATTPSDLDGLTVILGVDRKNVYDPITKVTDLSNIPNIDVSGADHFVVAVVNTLQAGDSKRPGLCVGSPEEVEQCVANAQGAGGAGGGGSSATSTSSGSEKPGADKGCSCSTSGAGEAPIGACILGATVALGLRARRRRPSSIRAS
jgi:MYXO-CTERM domain-containing protein